MILQTGMFSTLLASFTIIGALLPFVKSSTVSTIYGDIEGFVASYSAYSNTSFPFKSVTKFLGVPFAAPPIGELRFKSPEPPKAWKPKVLPAKTHGNRCSHSEDCLFLDVYTPNVSLSLPVLFYIHGGAYTSGAAVLYPSDILALHGVVVVVIQYRLGPFGFLTTGDSAAPGNFGMLDQVEALKWVQENIDHFGGDPSNVTIFGESAGATSVALQLLSPLSQGLFHQAIAESGVDLSSFAIQPTTLGIRFAKELAQNLDCTTSEHNAMVACMREKKGAEIERASEKLEYFLADVLMWAPVVDKIFLLDTPRNLREKGEFKKVKLMISFNSHEGASYVGAIAGLTFGMTENVGSGVNQSFFNEFVTKFAYMYARNSK